MEIEVYSFEEYVSVTVVDGCRPIACANMDLIGDFWYLCRLKVNPENKRQGWGTKMIEKLKEEAGGLPIVVQPGGYAETSMEIKNAFYHSCGFKDFDHGMRLETNDN